MLGSIFGRAACLVVSLGLLVPLVRAASADDDKPPADKDQKAGLTRAQLEDVPQPFVPEHPRTVEDRQRIEAMQAFTAARALEDQRDWQGAIDMLKDALKKDPDSLAILRRLSRLCFATTKTDEAVGYSRKVIEADPNDDDTIHRLVRYYEHRNDPDSAETLLTHVIANPKLEKNSAAELQAEKDLGVLYTAKLGRIGRNERDFKTNLDKAADAFEHFINGLDTKAASQLPPGVLKRLLGDEAETYRSAGVILHEAKRYAIASKAFERGLVYDPANAQLTHLLAKSLLAEGKNDEALAVAERFRKQLPQLRESYDLLAQCLTALHRKDEVVPRLEALAKENPKNAAIKYALAAQYGEAGQSDKASALFKELRANTNAPQDFGALSAWLLKEKRTEELITLVGEAVSSRTRDGLEAVMPQLNAIVADPAYADQVFETGLKMIQATPPKLSMDSRKALDFIAGQLKKPEKMLPIHRLAVKQEPSALEYEMLADSLVAAKQYDEAVSVIEEILKKYPEKRDAKLLLHLGRLQAQVGKKDDAIKSYREAYKLEPNDQETAARVCIGLSGAGKDDEAVEIAKKLIQANPDNPALHQVYTHSLLQLGKSEEAIAHYKSLLERYPNDDELVKIAHAGLSAVYVNLEDYAKGEAELEVILDKYPEDPGVNNDLGYLYADQGKNLDKAEAMIRKAVAEEPDNHFYLDSLGWVLFKRGKTKEALPPLEKAASKASEESASTDSTIHDHLGDVYFRLHEYAKAKAAWEQALKLGKDAAMPDKRLPEIKKKLDSLKEIEPAPRASTGDNP